MSGPVETIGTGIRLHLQVQPRAPHTELAGVRGQLLRIRVSAPPVDGEANAALVRFLSERLGVGRTGIRVRAGLTSRRKIVEVGGLTAQQAIERLGL